MRALLYVFSRLGALVYLMAHPRVPFWVKLLPVLAFLYFIWPVDLIFDFPPFIGHIDDFVVVLLLFNAFFWLAQRYAGRPPPDPDDGRTVQAEFYVVDPDGGAGQEDTEDDKPVDDSPADDSPADDSKEDPS